MNSNDIINGIVIKSIAGFCYVEAGNRVYECKPRGYFRKDGNIIVAGDNVGFTPDGDKGVVEILSDRKNFLVRPPLANIDKLFIVSSCSVPACNPMLIDRMTAISEFLNIEPIIIFNKSDLGDFGNYPEIYKKAGYKTFTVSAKTSEGVNSLHKEINGCISAFSGNSGVGKSSLLNRLLPDAALTTGEVSNKLGRGRHTTRQVELFRVNGGYVADTPGFSSFELTDFFMNDKDKLKYCFREFADYIDKCKFTSCSHTSELGCAVIDAVKSGKIFESRHHSYVEMYDNLKRIKSWELKSK